MVSLMGILNLSPDSFLASSRYDTLGAADAVSRLESEGASIIDIGAVSSRPGAAEVGEEEEWRRLEGFLRLISKMEGRKAALSIDTTNSETVRRAFDIVGPFIVNDISAGQDDSRMLSTVAELGLGYIAMHRRGNPRTMDSLARYPEGVVKEVLRYFEVFSLKAAEAGITEWILDPGFGFAKTREQNLELLHGLGSLKCFSRKILAGIADKRFTRETLPDGREINRSTEYNVEAALLGASILRVHDVALTRQALEKNDIAYA